MTPRSLSQVTDLIVHHTAGALTQTPQEIDAEHRAEGWAMIGYEYVITPDGTIYDGRPLDVVPSAAYGRNTQSVDVVLVGNFQASDPGYTGPPSAAQMQSLKDFALWIHQQIPSICRTIGHGDVARMFYPDDEGDYSTACPGSELESQLPEIRSYVASKLNGK